jgi:hypothetical protein
VLVFLFLIAARAERAVRTRVTPAAG